MQRILFICHGNICRSPMAEFIMKELAREAGVSAQLEIASAGTSAEEYGNPVYPPAKRLLAQRGIACADKRARQVSRGEYAQWDHLICMERYNLRNLQRIMGGDPEGKMSLLMSFAGRDEDIDDPWYNGNFEGVYKQIEVGCRALLAQLARENGAR